MFLFFLSLLRRVKQFASHHKLRSLTPANQNLLTSKRKKTVVLVRKLLHLHFIPCLRVILYSEKIRRSTNWPLPVMALRQPQWWIIGFLHCNAIPRPMAALNSPPFVFGYLVATSSKTSMPSSPLDLSMQKMFARWL